jgi:glycogen debranching enzyme
MQVQKIIKKRKEFLLDTVKNPFQGLPELTNQDGHFCHPSCPTQAWSTSVMLELYLDLVQ